MQLADADINLAIVGLGYVGLPLAVAFGNKIKTTGFDINVERVNELKKQIDSNNDFTKAELATAVKLNLSTNPEDLDACNIYIVTVPTPIDANRNPDFQPLISATKMIAKYLKPSNIVIYESTVYPGAIEEVCVPLLEQITGLKYNQDFYIGYSPERINPGDKNKRLENITKITAGSTPAAADFIDNLYKKIITAGTHKVSSIAVAEAAKVIENTQRDLNIALINELAIIFNRMNLDTEEILKAAGTKWNFMPFTPGLVGGHCIGVDPYYLTYKAEAIGYRPEVILAGRRINDGMGKHVAAQVVKLMLARKIHIAGANVLILGLTFKENCPDVRNTRVVDIIDELRDFGAAVHVYDPLADPQKVKHEYDLEMLSQPKENAYDAIIMAVPHAEFKEMTEADVRRFGKEAHVLYDVKYMLPRTATDGRL